MSITLWKQNPDNGVYSIFFESNFTYQRISGNNIAYGYNQQWVDVTSSRALTTNYTNSTGRGIYVVVTSTSSSSSGLYLQLNYPFTLSLGFTVNNSYGKSYVFGFIPPNNTYRVVADGTYGGSLGTWLEMR